MVLPDPSGEVVLPDPSGEGGGGPAGTLTSRRSDLLAGLLTAVATVLAGAPVGLLWAALAPRAEAVLAGGTYLQADPASAAFIAGDGYLSAACLVAGVVTGALAWVLARRHGPAVVPALALAGLAAAYVASRVGGQVGLEALRSGARAQVPRLDLTLKLGADAVLAVWPAAAVLTFLVATLLCGSGSEAGLLSRSVQAEGPSRQLG